MRSVTPLKFVRRLATVSGIGFVAFALSAWCFAGALLKPANRHVGPPPHDFPVVEAMIEAESGSRIATWYASVKDAPASIILVHGLRGNRLKLLDRARLFRQAGYSVIMLDLQAHGESSGSTITLGHLERHDVRAAVAYARKLNPDHRIGVVGISLGGAAALLASPLDIDAIVLESVFPTITEAVHNRISAQLGPLSYALSPALLCQLQPRLGVSSADLRPIDKIGSLACPVLVASGDLDRNTTIAETRRLYETANDPKQLTIFEGAAHTDLFARDPQKYKDEILPFFDLHLKPRQSE